LGPLSHPRAPPEALEYLGRVHFTSDIPADVDSDDTHVIVRLTRHQPTSFLRLLQIREMTISATGRAALCAGVVETRCD
jgi:hypothetical protein